MLSVLFAIKDPEFRFIILAIWLMIFTVVPLSLATYWLLDTAQPVEVISSRVIGRTENNPRSVIVERRLKRLRFCEGISHRWVANGVVYQLSPLWVGTEGVTTKDDPKRETVRVTVDLPHYLGNTAVYRSVIHYSCNPLQKLFPLVVMLPDVFINLEGLPTIEDNLSSGSRDPFYPLIFVKRP